MRMAPTLVRFGSFEIFYARRERDYLEHLANHVIENFYSEFKIGRPHV